MANGREQRRERVAAGSRCGCRRCWYSTRVRLSACSLIVGARSAVVARVARPSVAERLVREPGSGVAIVSFARCCRGSGGGSTIPPGGYAGRRPGLNGRRMKPAVLVSIGLVLGAIVAALVIAAPVPAGSRLRAGRPHRRDLLLHDRALRPDLRRGHRRPRLLRLEVPGRPRRHVGRPADPRHHLARGPLDAHPDGHRRLDRRRLLDRAEPQRRLRGRRAASTCTSTLTSSAGATTTSTPSTGSRRRTRWSCPRTCRCASRSRRTT